MKALIDISEEMYNRIKKVNSDSSLQNFILMAIENQISLENEQHSEIIDLERNIPKTPIFNKPKQSEPKQLSNSIDTVEMLRNPLAYEKLTTISLKKPIKDYYIWGQYNKFFAMKFAVRYLAYKQIRNNPARVKLNEFQNECSKAASVMKDILKHSDKQADRIWGEGFSAGLPEFEEKSWSRFIHHFIGYTDSKGNQVGALSDLGLIVIENGQVALSPQGLEFAKIKNPILDENPFSSVLFSPDEQQFLLNHLKTNIPTEWSGIQTVFQWIESGINTPDTLNAKFSALDPKWTEKMANTYRTGMLARMYDLGFITRKKIGVNANYVVTEIGKRMVGRHD